MQLSLSLYNALSNGQEACTTIINVKVTKPVKLTNKCVINAKLNGIRLIAINFYLNKTHTNALHVANLIPDARQFVRI
jgi:hypothetical protein